VKEAVHFEVRGAQVRTSSPVRRPARPERTLAASP
jgi:hypothetical protein